MLVHSSQIQQNRLFRSLQMPNKSSCNFKNTRFHVCWASKLYNSPFFPRKKISNQHSKFKYINQFGLKWLTAKPAVSVGNRPMTYIFVMEIIFSFLIRDATLVEDWECKLRATERFASILISKTFLKWIRKYQLLLLCFVNESRM